MKLRKLSLVLLALLLAAMAMVPMVSAASTQQSEKVQMAELNTFAANENSKPLPQLQYDKNQKLVAVNGEFQVDANTQDSQIRSSIATSANPTVSQLPFGSIVYHSGRTTTVFDSTGKELFAVEDATTPLISTPDGSLPATSVFEIPDKSLIMENENIINVFNDKKRILTVMGNPAGARMKSVSNQRTYSTESAPKRWIEYGETLPISIVGQFSARWNVPKKPTMVNNFTAAHDSLDGSQSVIWNGLQQNDTYLLQPCLEWYVRDKAYSPYPTEANWSITTWWVSPREYNNNGFHLVRRYGIPSTGELVSTGDLIQGNMYYYGGAWTGTITDLTLGISSAMYLNTSQSSDLKYRNLSAYTVLEGWVTGSLDPSNINASYIPGNITFGNIIINDRDGNSVIPSVMPGYVNTVIWDETAYGLSVANTSWPTSIKLNTGNI